MEKNKFNDLQVHLETVLCLFVHRCNKQNWAYFLLTNRICQVFQGEDLSFNQIPEKDQYNLFLLRGKPQLLDLSNSKWHVFPLGLLCRIAQGLKLSLKRFVPYLMFLDWEIKQRNRCLRLYVKYHENCSDSDALSDKFLTIVQSLQSSQVNIFSHNGL